MNNQYYTGMLEYRFQGAYAPYGGGGMPASQPFPTASIPTSPSGYVPPLRSGAPGSQQRAAEMPPARVIKTAKSTYVVVRSLERGAQASAVLAGKVAGVNVVRRRECGGLFVEKLLPGTTREIRARAAAEVAALEQIRNAGMPSFLNAYQEIHVAGNGDFCNLFLEYCDMGTVLTLIEAARSSLGNVAGPYVWHILAGISKALFFCHTGVNADNPGPTDPAWNTICHLDVKPSNIFLSSKGRKNDFPRVVLGDFGIATTWKIIESGEAKRTVQLSGTPGWFPPECMASSFGGWDGRYGMPTDVWQMGGVVQAMCRLLDLPDQTTATEGRACGRKYTTELNAVASCCMKVDPLKRPRAEHVALEAKKQLEEHGLKF